MLCEEIKHKFQEMHAGDRKNDFQRIFESENWSKKCHAKKTCPYMSKELLGFPPKKNQDWFDINDPHATALINKLHLTHINDKSFKQSKYIKCKSS